MNNKKLVIIIILLILLLLYNHIQISKFRVNKVKFESEKLTRPIKISQITDFHSNKKVNLIKLGESIKKYEPDIIVLTGDIIDSKTSDLSTALSLIDVLVTLDRPLYFVEGNHEELNPKRSEFLSGLRERGVDILDNESRLVSINNERVRILGLPFLAGSKDFQKTLDKASPNILDILLSHSPNRPIKYLDERIDFVLSGHTHGGQVRLPIVGALLAPGQGIFPKYDKGLIRLDSGPLIYIDSGLGNSVLPIRFLNKVQISEITIKPL